MNESVVRLELARVVWQGARLMACCKVDTGRRSGLRLYCEGVIKQYCPVEIGRGVRGGVLSAVILGVLSQSVRRKLSGAETAFTSRAKV